MKLKNNKPLKTDQYNKDDFDALTARCVSVLSNKYPGYKKQHYIDYAINLLTFRYQDEMINNMSKWYKENRKIGV